MLVCGLDIESTGLSVTEDRIIEVGAVLWDTERKTPLLVFSHLVNPCIPISKEITEITGIAQDDLDRYGRPVTEVLSELNVILEKADTIVGHNALGFDKPFLENELARNGLPVVPRPWIDTSVDVLYPESIKTRKLVHLAAEHGFINPFAHRAFSDVLTMLSVLNFYDAEEVYKTSLEPSVTLLAQLKKPWQDPAPEGKKDTDLARGLGYRWNGTLKQWLKVVKKSRLEAEIAAAPFSVQVEG
jgi:DNA polymerase-3 subunit epsilon